MALRASRRRLLAGIAVGAVGLSTVGVSASDDGDDGPPGADGNRKETARSGALDWARRAVWPGLGLSTEFPEQVVYPKDSRLATIALAEQGEADRIDSTSIAETAATLQTDDGGFFSHAGDFLGPWVGATRHGVALATEHDVSVDEAAAGRFLKAHQTDAGGFAPRKAFLGDRLTDPTMAATNDAIRGLARVGMLDTETEADAVSFLLEHQRDTGGWPNNPDAADASVRGTYYAVAALAAVDALSTADVDGAVQFLLSVQQPTGGFRERIPPVACGIQGTLVTCQTQPEVTTTATTHAILTLARLDALDRIGETQPLHARWLADRQRTDPEDQRFHGAFESYGPTATSTVKPQYLNNTRLALRALDRIDGLDRIDRAAALSFVGACQHPGSSGLGAWPGYVASIRNSEAAVRTFDALDAAAEYPAAALASTLAAHQESNGAIVSPDYSPAPNTSQTALALLACASLGTYGEVDVPAAAGFIADHQQDDGGFADTNPSTVQETTPTSGTGPGSAPRVTWYAVRALAAVDERERMDEAAVGSYFAELQEADGAITDSGGHEAIYHTHFALSALDAIGRSSAVDVAAAVEYLASQQLADGTFEREDTAFHVILGLRAVDALDAIDTDGAREYLESRQRPAGGFTNRGFYTGDTAMERHAGIVEAIRALGGLRGRGRVPVDPPAGGQPECRPPAEPVGRQERTAATGWQATVTQNPHRDRACRDRQ